MVSLRADRFTTNPPAMAIAYAMVGPLPHWPGETQAASVTSIISARAKLVGFQRCFPWTRIRNLLPIASAAVRAAIHQKFDRKRKQSPSPEIRALFHSNPGIRRARVRASWTTRAVPIVATIWIGGTSKESRKSPYVSSPERQQICHQRGSKRRAPGGGGAVVACSVVMALGLRRLGDYYSALTRLLPR